MEKQIMHDHFELAAYDALYPLRSPLSCRPLYHRDPKKSDGALLTPNQGRRLFLFEKAEGETYHYGLWRGLNPYQKVRVTATDRRVITPTDHLAVIPACQISPRRCHSLSTPATREVLFRLGVGAHLWANKRRLPYPRRADTRVLHRTSYC